MVWRICLILLLVLAWPGLAAAQTFPELTGRVVDAANILPPDIETQLTAKLDGLEQQTGRQLVVATIPSLDGYEISDYGYRLGRHWGIGDKERNDGVLLIVAPNDRQVRIEVGYGLEPVLTDGLSFLIINDVILPKFKAGDMPGGIVDGTDAIIHQLALPEDEAKQFAAQAAQQAQPEQGVPVGLIIWIIFFTLFFLIPMIRTIREGPSARRSRSGPFIFTPGGFSGGSSSGGYRPSRAGCRYCSFM